MTTTDEHDEPCTYAWCVAHATCTCPYSDQFPHPRARCRYATTDKDDEQ